MELALEGSLRQAACRQKFAVTQAYEQGTWTPERGRGSLGWGAGCGELVLALEGRPRRDEMPARVEKAARGATGGGGVVIGLLRAAEVLETPGRALPGVREAGPASKQCV